MDNGGQPRQPAQKYDGQWRDAPRAPAPKKPGWGWRKTKAIVGNALGGLMAGCVLGVVISIVASLTVGGVAGPITAIVCMALGLVAGLLVGMSSSE